MGRLYRALALLAVLCVAGDAGATTIRYSVTQVAGNTFEYAYRVENDSLAVAIEEFAVFFDVNLFENLSAPTSAAGWDPLLIEPDPILADDGFADWLVLTADSEIAPGETLDGFGVRVDFLGLGTPGSQFFDVRDASFVLLDTGFTVPLPEPGTGLLLLLGLAAVARTGRGTR